MFEIISKSLIFAENRQNGENNCKTASNQFGNVVYSTLCIVAETKQNEKFLRLLVFGFTISSEKVSRGDQKNLWILRSAEKSSGAL